MPLTFKSIHGDIRKWECKTDYGHRCWGIKHKFCACASLAGGCQGFDTRKQAQEYCKRERAEYAAKQKGS